MGGERIELSYLSVSDFESDASTNFATRPFCWFHHHNTPIYFAQEIHNLLNLPSDRSLWRAILVQDGTTEPSELVWAYLRVECCWGRRRLAPAPKTHLPSVFGNQLLMWYMLLDLFCKTVNKSYSRLLMTVFPLVLTNSPSSRIFPKFDGSGYDYSSVYKGR